jgi:hypothetical protein
MRTVTARRAILPHDPVTPFLPRTAHSIGPHTALDEAQSEPRRAPSDDGDVSSRLSGTCRVSEVSGELIQLPILGHNRQIGSDGAHLHVPRVGL